MNIKHPKFSDLSGQKKRVPLNEQQPRLKRFPQIQKEENVMETKHTLAGIIQGLKHSKPLPVVQSSLLPPFARQFSQPNLLVGKCSAYFQRTSRILRLASASTKMECALTRRPTAMDIATQTGRDPVC